MAYETRRAQVTADFIKDVGQMKIRGAVTLLRQVKGTDYPSPPPITAKGRRSLAQRNYDKAAKKVTLATPPWEKGKGRK